MTNERRHASAGVNQRRFSVSTVEKKEVALKKKLRTVLEDKEKIDETIEELD